MFGLLRKYRYIYFIRCRECGNITTIETDEPEYMPGDRIEEFCDNCLEETTHFVGGWSRCRL